MAIKKNPSLLLPLGEAAATVRRKDDRNRPSARHEEEGRYANSFQIGHNAFEFLIEFGQHQAGESAFHTRIYVSPQHARILANLLTATLKQHERIFGKSLKIVPREPEPE
jgi:hypothetical protein